MKNPLLEKLFRAAFFITCHDDHGALHEYLWRHGLKTEDVSADEIREVLKKNPAIPSIPGVNILELAIESLGPLPEQITFDGQVERLKAVCGYLQSIAGENPFFLSRRDAGRVLGISDPHLIRAILHGLTVDKFMVVEAKGTTVKAARFKLCKP